MLAPAQKAFVTLLSKRITFTSFEDSCDLIADEMFALISRLRALKSEGLLR
jgi:hypothetical protein